MALGLVLIRYCTVNNATQVQKRPRQNYLKLLGFFVKALQASLIFAFWSSRGRGEKYRMCTVWKLNAFIGTIRVHYFKEGNARALACWVI